MNFSTMVTAYRARRRLRRLRRAASHPFKQLRRRHSAGPDRLVERVRETRRHWADGPKVPQRDAVERLVENVRATGRHWADGAKVPTRDAVDRLASRRR